MRVEHGFLGLVLAGTVMGVAFVGCGSSVAEQPGGGGSGGSGGSTAVTTSVPTTTGTTVTGTESGTVTGSTTGTTSTTGSSTMTGNPKCVAACDHIQQCLGLSCAQIPNLDCGQVGNQFDCELDCIATTQCAQLGLNTLQDCQKKCAGDGGTPPGDGGSAAACQQCAVTACGQVALPCAQDSACASWFQCLGGCMQQSPVDPACAPACDAQFPTAKAKYDPIYACACTSCSSQCAALDPCNH